MNISKSNRTESGCGLLYLIYALGLLQPRIVTKYSSLSILVFLWNKDKITVKVEETSCRKWLLKHSAMIGSE